MSSRKIFEALSIFDWITPLIGLVETFAHDPTLLQTNSWTFFIPYDRALDSGWNAIDIEELLQQHGIKTWGSQITGGEYFFTVAYNNAQWSEYILQRHGIPINERFLGAPPPAGKEAGRDVFRWFMDWLDS